MDSIGVDGCCRIRGFVALFNLETQQHRHLPAEDKVFGRRKATSKDFKGLLQLVSQTAGRFLSRC